jgi:glycosyltransferase involved in cell wall biosynthesis
MVRIASVVFSYYPSDPRPRREAEAMVEAGMSVDVFCLRSKGELRTEKVNGVQVYRLPVSRTRKGKCHYIWEYSYFTGLALFTLSLFHILKRYHLIHIHNMPDILIICTLIPRLTGARIILDLHDPMPEVYITKYSIKPSHPVIRALCALERISIHFANLVLTPNIAFRDLFVSRGCPERKIHIVMNSPQESIFNVNCDERTLMNRNGFVIMYHGTITERNGLETALEAMILLKKEISNLRFEVYGSGDFITQFLERVDQLNLNSIVNFHGYKPLQTIAKAIQSINVGIIPNQMSPFTNLNLPTRIFEYLALNKPVVAPRTKGILDYFDNGSLYFFDPGNADSLVNTILDIYHNPSRCQLVLERGTKIYNMHRWEFEKKYFLSLVKNLLKMDNQSFIS